jgi:hypothetical protein
MIYRGAADQTMQRGSGIGVAPYELQSLLAGSESNLPLPESVEGMVLGVRILGVQ